MFDDPRKVKARIVGIASEGGEMRFVVPKRKPFVEFHWEVLQRLFIIGVLFGLFFGCGFLAGLFTGG